MSTVIATQYGIPIDENINKPEMRRKYELSRRQFELINQQNQINKEINEINKELKQEEYSLSNNVVQCQSPMYLANVLQSPPSPPIIAARRTDFVRFNSNTHKEVYTKIPADLHTNISKLSDCCKAYDYKQEASKEVFKTKFIGRKINYKELINKVFLILYHEIRMSKYKNKNGEFKQYAAIQIEIENEKRLFETSSKIIMNTLEHSIPYNCISCILRIHPITNNMYLDDPE